MAEKLMKYADAVKKFDPVIGLETHVELSTTTKLFCPAEVHFGGEPNTQLTPVSLGLPGSLPVVNKTAVDYAIKLGLALHCEIAEWSQFARKNYFYPARTPTSVALTAVSKAPTTRWSTTTAPACR